MKSVLTALRVFEEVSARQPVGLSELSRSLGVPKASVQRALATLADAGWLRYDMQRPGQWVVTARFSVLTDVDPDLIAVRRAARPHLPRLQEAADAEAVGLFVLDGDRMVLLAAPDSDAVVKPVEEMLGPLPVHLSAAGRAILAHLDAEVRDAMLARAFPAPEQRADLERVKARVRDARRRGYAVAAGEFYGDLGMVAAPVMAAGLPVAGLTVVVPVGRLGGRGAARLGHLVADTARDVSASAEPGVVPVAR